MANSVSDFLVQRLADWGISRIFGYPGDGINGILGALDRADDKMHFVQSRHICVLTRRIPAELFRNKSLRTACSR